MDQQTHQQHQNFAGYVPSDFPRDSSYSPQLRVLGFQYSIFSTTIFFVFLSYLVEIYLVLRQMSTLSNQRGPPKRLIHLFDPSWFTRIKQHTLASLRFALLELTVATGIEVFALYNGWLVFFWDSSLTILQFAGYSPDFRVTRGVLYILLVSCVSSLFRMGLHLTKKVFLGWKQNLRTFSLELWDLVKVFFVSLLFGIPLLTGIIRLMEWTGYKHWVYVWGLMATLSIFLHDIYLYAIAPLFNTVYPLPDGPLRTKLERLASLMQVPLNDILVIESSRRSHHTNAFLAGFGINRKLVIYDTMFAKNTGNLQFTINEVVGIVSHELSHVKQNHFWKKLLLQLAWSMIFLLLSTMVIWNQEIYLSFGFTTYDYAVGLVLFGYLYSTVGNYLHLFTNLFSVQFEFSADSNAQKCLLMLGSSYKKSLGNALIKMHILNSQFANMNPDGFYGLYTFSHPALVDRLELIDSIKEKKTR